MSCLIQKSLQRGMTELYGLPDRRLAHLSFGVARLEPGDRFGETLNRREAVLVLLAGRAHVKGQGFDLGEIDAAAAPDAAPTAIYCGPGLFTVKARTEAEVLVLRRECGPKYKNDSRLLDPAEIGDATPGDGAAACRRRALYRPTVDGSGLMAGATAFGPDAAPFCPWTPELTADGATEAALFFRIDGEGKALARLDGCTDVCEQAV
ncbi:MAG: 5-deoxy-glucuronate isomerase, partial [Planctomycetota bacterium]